MMLKKELGRDSCWWWRLYAHYSAIIVLTTSNDRLATTSYWLLDK